MKLKHTLAAVIAVAAMSGIAATAHAAGVVIPGTGYAGVAGDGSHGVDAWGQPWIWGKTSGGYGVAAGLAAWGTPGLGKGTVDEYQGSMPATGFEIAFVNPLADINQYPSPYAGGYNESTRFDVCSSTCVEWIPHFIGGNEVVFSAPAGSSLTDGEDYFVNVIFDEGSHVVNGSTTGFTAAFLAVPEPAAWAMVLLGVGMIGAGLRMDRRRDATGLTPA
jgi:PEP-CTERM motif